MTAHDVIIAGLGAAGSAAAYHLAKRGMRVLGLDRFAPPHDRGSHAGHTRLIRLCYFEHPDYVPLLRRSYELWRELEVNAGETILQTHGGLYTGPREGEFIQGTLRAAAEHRLAIEPLAERDLHERFPLFRVPDSHAALFEPTAGFLYSDRAIAAHLAMAARSGADLRTNEPAEEWGASAEGAWVGTLKGRYASRTLVLAAGAWMPRLWGAAVSLRVTRQALAWFDVSDPRAMSAPGFPVWASVDEDNSLYYGFPALAHPDHGMSVKVARHHPGDPLAHAESPRREIDASDTGPLVSFLGRRLPAAQGRILAASTCLYTSTPDQHFIIDRHPDHRNVIVASPCSGHGFKFSTVLGELLADLATGAESPLAAEFLSFRRL